MNICLTGGAGFIGTWLWRELESAGHDVYAVDRTYGYDHDLHTLDGIERLIPGTDVVVHLAAQVGRLSGEDHAETTILSNAVVTTRVAKRCAEIGSRLVYTSTSEIYGDLATQTALEQSRPTLPHNLYGLTKRWGEEAAALYAASTGLQIIRPSMPYGPGLPAGRGRAAIINMLAQAAAGEPVTVHRGAERAWCWIGDTVRGIRIVIEDGEVCHDPGAVEWGTGCYNIGRADNALPMLSVARLACLITGADEAQIIEVDAPANQTVVKRLGSGKLMALGWLPTVDVAEGMRRTWTAMQRPDYPGGQHVPARSGHG